jgi:ribonuclease T2
MTRPTEISIKLVLAMGAMGALFAVTACDSSHAPDVQIDKPDQPAVRAAPPARPGFDFYLLALSVHAAFCADGHAQLSECQARAAWPLVLHGLWPENREPRSYPHDCAAPPLALDAALALDLQPYMPGMAAGLHEHEWRKHGGCTGLDDDVYFARALELTRGLEQALAARLTTLAGNETSAAELRAAAEQFRPGIGATFTLHCHTLRNAPSNLRERAYLVEIRQCFARDPVSGAPGVPLECEKLRRRDQGCGKSFMIAGGR